MTWVYIKTEPRLWTVGFYDPEGKFQTDSDHDSTASAAARVHFLNGGGEDTFNQYVTDRAMGRIAGEAVWSD